jgi:glycosyltransferase involved in cell wall biosynthesis
MQCSVIICTRNRASTLERTLHSFQSVKAPDGWSVEIIVADNGSTDATVSVVTKASHPTIEIRYVFEPRPGKSRAQNTALAVARGEVLLFTDDDVEPADNWVENMARPLLENRCEAVAGRILLAEDLRRPWFTQLHEMWLAEVREPAVNSPELVGASMGIHRSVFETIGNFDEKLGPGATGFGEETLVWMQMMEAGLRIFPVNDTFVIHRPDPSRLLRCAWLSAAARYGRTNAYLMHHWQHARVPYPALRVCLLRMKLFLRRLPRRSQPLDAEGCSDWEMSYLTRIEGLERFIEESGRPRNYGPRALGGTPALSKPWMLSRMDSLVQTED